MRTTFDVADMIYNILNAAAVNNAIDGMIYKGKKPVNSEKQDIVINTLPISNDDTQRITVIINCYSKNFEATGTQDIATMKIIAEAVITELESYSKTEGTYFQYDVINQIVMNDNDQKNMSYVSIRLNCWIENN
jgi:hypothetical protein